MRQLPCFVSSHCFIPIWKTYHSRESKPKQSQRHGESAPEMPVGRAYAVESLAVGKSLRSTFMQTAQRWVFEDRFLRVSWQIFYFIDQMAWLKRVYSNE